MQEKEQLSPEELQVQQLNTDNQNTPEEITADDLDVKNYIKISPTFYVHSVKNENEDDETELFKVLNPETQKVETRELSDDEKKEIYVLELKRSKRVFNPIKHDGNKTINQFNTKYKQKRQRKNKMAKASRKANR